MKLKNRVVNSIKAIKDSSRRFPLTLVISTLLVIVRIYMYEMEFDYNSDLYDKYTRISMVVGLGILLSLFIGLFAERFFKKDRLKEALGQGLGLVFLLAYYFLLLKEINHVSMIRYLATIISFFIAFFYIARIKIEGDYEYYTINLFESISETIIYAFVLLFGMYMILFTIDQLFDANMDSKYYYYVFLFIYLLFAPAFLISRLPAPFEDFTKFQYRKSLSILLTYIVIPLISIYTLILYVYFGKIIIQWDWPKGLVSHLVLWYSSLSVGVIFLISPIADENKIRKQFKRYFPKLILPILLMMYISIGQRINQYGITENRYYIVVLGLWVTAMMIFYSFGKDSKNIIVPITLSLLVLNSAYGPLSSMSISKYSQNKRLRKILLNNGMLEENKVVSKRDIDDKSQKEINNIIKYFNNYHSLGKVKVVDKDFTTNKMEEVFGFPYKDSDTDFYEAIEEFYYSSMDSDSLEVVDIGDYDYYVNLISYMERLEGKIANLNIKQDKEGLLEIFRGQDLLISKDLRDLAKDIDNRFKDKDDEAKNISMEKFSYEFEEKNIKIKLIFNEISGRIEENGKGPKIYHFNYILLIKEK